MRADGARKLFMDVPLRQPRRLALHHMVVGFENRRQVVETLAWLHSVHGDPITGKARREYAEKSQPELDELGVAGESVEELEIEVVVDSPRRNAMTRAYLEGLSQVEFSAASQLSKDGMVATRWEIHATHTGALFGVPGTGRDLSFTGMTLVRFDKSPAPEGGFVLTATDEWTYWDLPGLMEQIGASP